MTSALILVPEAKADVADAYLWYEEQSLGLGMDFLRCVEAALLSIHIRNDAYRRQPLAD